MIVNQDIEKLKSFIIVFKSMRAMEDALIELEEFDVPYSFSKFFDDYRSLSMNIEKKIDISNLTQDKLNKYKQLNLEIMERLKWDYPSFYQIKNNVEQTFYEAYQEADKAIEKMLQPYEGNKRPFFSCGVSSFNLYIHEASSLGLLLNDGIDLEGYFTYENGHLDMNTSNLFKKYEINCQEYPIFEAAYRACMDVLNTRFNLKGSVSSFID